MFRTSRSSWCVWLLVVSLFASYAVYVAVTAPPRVPYIERLKIVSIPCLAVLLVIAWLAAYRLEIDQSTITYRTLFSRSRTIRRENIIEAGFAEHTKPTEGLMIFVLRTSSGDEMRINVKPFSRTVFAALNEFTDS